MLDKSKQEIDGFSRRQQFQELAFQHVDSLYNTAVRMTRNNLDAEDLLQDVYLRAYRFFHRFEQGTNFKAWIFKILTNTYINQYRRKVSRPFHVGLEKVKHHFSDADREANSIPTQLDANVRLDYKELFDDEIKGALEQLPDEFRMVVLLADVESFSYKEIAHIVGCPLGTVMSRLSRGRKQLQSHLKDYALRGGFINKDTMEN